MTAAELTTRWADITDLRPHPSNPRNGDIDAITESLIANGQYRPIVTAEDGTILAGNHTYMAALGLGWTQLATVTLPVGPHSPEAIRIMLADNRISERGNFDTGMLHALLASLDEMDGLVGTGYNDDDLAALAELNGAPALDDLPDEPLDDDELLVPVRLMLPKDLAAALNAHLSQLGGGPAAHAQVALAVVTV